MKIYNISSMDRNSRFLLAILAGLATAIGLAIVYYFFISWAHIEFSIFYIFFGWCIGEVIKKIGHGVTLKFQIIGAILTTIGLILADTFLTYGISMGFLMLVNPSFWPTILQSWIALHLSTNINTLLGLLFRIGGIYYGFYNSIIF